MPTTKKGDVRATLPPGMPANDMDAAGDRSGPLEAYGPPNADETVERVLAAWGVRGRYLVNPATGGRPPRPDRAGGPIYMLLFADGLWRYASFIGVNGPPWFWCRWAGGVKAANGEAAYVEMKLVAKILNRRTIEQSLRDLDREIIELRGQLAEANKKGATKQ